MVVPRAPCAFCPVPDKLFLLLNHRFVNWEDREVAAPLQRLLGLAAQFAPHERNSPGANGWKTTAKTADFWMEI